MWWFLVFGIAVQRCGSQFVHINDPPKISYQIVGIFQENAGIQKLAFNETMHFKNLLDPIFITTYRNDSYSAWNDLCSFSENTEISPVAIFGPQNPISDGAIKDQAALANIPHIQATFQPMDPDLDFNEELETEDANEEDVNDEATDETADREKTTFKKISINFFPDSDEFALAHAKLVKYYRWENFAALYEDKYGLLRVQKIISETSKKSRILMYKLNANGDNRKVFKELAKYQDISRFIIDCHVKNIKKYMQEAAELKMFGDYQHYILVSMDTSTIAESIQHLPSNFTWLSLTDYTKIIRGHPLATRVGQWNDPIDNSARVVNYEMESLVMADVANHLAKALSNFTDLELNQFSCGNEDAWESGAAIQQAILETNSSGITGNIAFDEKGRRKNYKLYVNEIHISKINTIGWWDSENPDAIIENNLASGDGSAKQTRKHFIIISRKAKPYFFDKQKCPDNDENCVEENNDPLYEGFSVDLVKEIFDIFKEEKLNYTYSFRHDKDEYGKLDTTTKKWDGLIGDLLDKSADLAVCDLTITEERKKAVDFSVPFMSLGISILYVQEREVPPEFFSFLNPYTFEVWICSATAYCLVSIVLFVCARISPADWENPEPCEKEPEELENIWTFKNCTWLTMGSIMTQGCDILPKAIGTRWICGMWWFFAVIVCQTYIAQLSASMTSALENEPINSVDDLAKQSKILYGAVDGGSTLEFFKSSKDKTYRRMYENMMSHPAVLVSNNDEGERRVTHSKNKYAFFMESATIEYKLKRNCDLKKVGVELDSKDYGIAMPSNSPFRKDINRAILKLKELTKLDKIKKKWWNEKYVEKACEEPKADDSDVEGDLEMKNLKGAFVVLIVGLVFCLFLTTIEFLNEVRNIVVREQVTYKEVFVKELRASLNLFQLQKPVLRNPSRVPSVAPSDGSDERREKRGNTIEDFLNLEKIGQ